MVLTCLRYVIPHIAALPKRPEHLCRSRAASDRRDHVQQPQPGRPHRGRRAACEELGIWPFPSRTCRSKRPSPSACSRKAGPESAPRTSRSVPTRSLSHKYQCFPVYTPHRPISGPLATLHSAAGLGSRDGLAAASGAGFRWFIELTGRGKKSSYPAGG
jgi:hypothetical protein